MIEQQMSAWQKMRKHEAAEAEFLLRVNERWCLNACHRFINRSSLGAAVWTLHDAGNISSLIVHAKHSLLPVFAQSGGSRKKIPPLNFLRGIFGMARIHSLQGRKEDVEILQAALEKAGLCAAEEIDYQQMCLEHTPGEYKTAGPAGLVIRKPQTADMDALVSLHAAYEIEEVLPGHSEFNASISRLNTERLFANEQMLVAVLGGRLVGKINTNALAFSPIQIGGVYVLPEYRGLGLARRLAGEFTADLASQGRGVSLFVKKSNSAANRVYRRIGFEKLGFYRICYF
jgi:predicted GNAT family acetyltransferase